MPSEVVDKAVVGGKKLWDDVRAAIRRQCPVGEAGYLVMVDEYVAQLFERYGDGTPGMGTMDLEGFKQAVLDITGDVPSMTDLEAAFAHFDKGAGASNDAVTAEEVLQAVMLTEEDTRELMRQLRTEIRKKFGRRESQMKEMFALLAEPNRGESVSCAVLVNLMEDWLKQELTEEEARSAMALIDMDGDGVVSLVDFMSFLGPAGEDIVAPGGATGLATRVSAAIVDINISTSRAEEAEAEANGYRKVDANLNEGTFGKSVHLWYRRRKHGGAGARLKPLVDIIIESKNVNSALVVDGYQCIKKDINRGNTLTKAKYVWIRRASTEEQETRDAIIDIAVTTGKAKDRTNEIYTPPGRGFVLVPGSLNSGTLGKDIFLWYKPLKSRRAGGLSGGVEYHVASTLTEAKRQGQLEKNIRRQIREYVAPMHVAGKEGDDVDYSTIFNKYDQPRVPGGKPKGRLTKSQLQRLLQEVGLNVSPKDLALFIARLDKDANGSISRAEWLDFVALTEEELDEAADELRRKYGASGMFKKVGKARRQQINALRKKFESLDQDGDGVLDRSDFSRMLQGAKLFLTRQEQNALRLRFDSKDDGLARVDLLRFLNFFLSKEDKDKRCAARVGKAMEMMRDFVLSQQVGKLQKANVDNIDSTTAWKKMSKQHKLSAKKAFPGYANVDDIAHLLEHSGGRQHLSYRELHQLVMRMAPTGGGRVMPEDFHQFAVIQPRLLGPLLRVLEKSLLHTLVESYRRLRHKQHRQEYKEKTNRFDETFGSTGGDALALVHTMNAATTTTTTTTSKKGTKDGGRTEAGGAGKGQASTRRNINVPQLRLDLSPAAGGDISHSSTISPLARTNGSPSTPTRAGTRRGLGMTSSSSSAAFGYRSRAPDGFLSTSGSVNELGMTAGGGDYSDIPLLLDKFNKEMEKAHVALKPDEHGFTNVQNVREGIAQLTNSDPSILLDTEWVQVAQAVGADEPELYLIDAKRLLEGICMACLQEDESGSDEVTLEDVVQTTNEALNLVCEDLVKMINDEARQPNGQMDYQKPFKLFDETGDGVIQVDEFRKMLYRLNVDSLLREAQVLQLIHRFDTDRKGEIMLPDFIAFAKKESWQAAGAGGPSGGMEDDDLGATLATRSPLGRGWTSPKGSRGFGGTGTLGSASINRTFRFADMDDGEELVNTARSSLSAGATPRFCGMKLTGSKAGDDLAFALMRKCRETFDDAEGRAAEGAVGRMEGKPGRHQVRWQDRARRGLMEAFTALDNDDVGSLSSADAMTALKRARLEPADLSSKDMERGLTAFQVVGSSTGGGGGVTVDYHKLVAAVGRAWRMTQLTKRAGEGGGITSDRRLNAKIANLQKEFRRISQVKSTDPKTGRVTYSYKMGKVFRKLDVNGDGVLTAKELKLGLRSLGIGPPLRDREVQLLFRAFDVNHSDGIDYREFCDFLLHSSLLSTSASAFTQQPGGSGRRSYDAFSDLDDDDDDDDDEYADANELFDGDLFSLTGPLKECADLLWAFAPTEPRQLQVTRYFQAKDHDGAGFVSERKFCDFLRKAGVTDTLTPDKVTALVEELDPKCKGHINYKRFLKQVFHPSRRKKDTPKKETDNSDIKPLLHKLQTAVVAATTKGKTYHGLFLLSDEARSGLVTKTAYLHTLVMLGADLSASEAQMIMDKLKARTDGMVDYEELYRLLLATAPPPHLSSSYAGGPPRRSLYSGGVALWPPAASMPPFGEAGDFWRGTLQPNGSGFAGSGGVRGDPLMDEVAARIRQRVLEKAQQWGASFSLTRQFEQHDPRHRGFVTAADLASVLDGLGVFLSSPELQHVVRAFDRYGDGAVDYLDLCQRIMFDSREMEVLAVKLQGRFDELRRAGVEVRAAFQMYDIRRTGLVSRVDFREAARKLSLPLTEHQLQGLFTRFALVGDPDAVSYEDLLSFAGTSMLPAARSYVGRGNGGGGAGGAFGDGDVGAWYSTRAGDDQRDEFEHLLDSLRSFRRKQNERDGLTLTGGSARGTADPGPAAMNGGDRGGTGSGRGAQPPPYVPPLQIEALSSYPYEYMPTRLSPSRSPTRRTGGGLSPRSPRLSPSQGGVKVWGAHTPIDKKGSLGFARSISSGGTWMCPVCFYTENESRNRLCQICNAPNPDSRKAELLQQCPNCSFHNDDVSVECQMCGEPLHYGRARAKIGGAAAASAMKDKDSGKDLPLSSAGRRNNASGWGIAESDNESSFGASDRREGREGRRNREHDNRNSHDSYRDQGYNSPPSRRRRLRGGRQRGRYSDAEDEDDFEDDVNGRW